MNGNEGPPTVRCTKDHRRVGDETFPGARPRVSAIGPLGTPRAAEDETRADTRRIARVVAELRAENEMLLLKLARVSTAIRGLASDLARSKRENRRKQIELESLQALAPPPGRGEATVTTSRSRRVRGTGHRAD